MCSSKLYKHILKQLGYLRFELEEDDICTKGRVSLQIEYLIKFGNLKSICPHFVHIGQDKNILSIYVNDYEIQCHVRHMTKSF